MNAVQTRTRTRVAPSRRTLGWLMALNVVWGVGMGTASETAIMPLFLASLGAPKSVIGLAPTVGSVCYALPLLAAAYVTGRLSRLKPLLILGQLAAAAPMAGLGALIWLGADAVRPSGLIVAFFVAHALKGASWGLVEPAWATFMARALPEGRRGLGMGVVSVCFSTGAIVGGWTAAHILGSLAFPTNFALCFALGSTLGASALSFLGPIREVPMGPSEARLPARAYLRRLVEGVRQHPAFLRYLWSRSALVPGTAVLYAFYAVCAQDRLGVGPAEAARLSPAFFAGMAAGALGLGHVGDRWGPLWGLCAAALTGLAGLSLATVTTSLAGFAAVAFCAGALMAGQNVGAFAFISALETGRGRTALFGVNNLMGSLLWALAPLAAGALIDAYGFAPVFAGYGVLATVGLVWLVHLAWATGPFAVGRVQETGR